MSEGNSSPEVSQPPSREKVRAVLDTLRRPTVLGTRYINNLIYAGGVGVAFALGDNPLWGAVAVGAVEGARLGRRVAARRTLLKEAWATGEMQSSQPGNGELAQLESKPMSEGSDSAEVVEQRSKKERVVNTMRALRFKFPSGALHGIEAVELFGTFIPPIDHPHTLTGMLAEAGLGALLGAVTIPGAKNVINYALGREQSNLRDRITAAVGVWRAGEPRGVEQVANSLVPPAIEK